MSGEDEQKSGQKEEVVNPQLARLQSKRIGHLTLPGCLKMFAKNFSLGCAIKTVINAISFFANPKKRRRFWRPPFGRTRLEMLRSLIDWRMGMFVGGLSTWKVISMLLRKLIALRFRKRPLSEQQTRRFDWERLAKSLSDILAGGLAGLSILWLDPRTTKIISLYSFVRAWEFIFILLAFRHLLPMWMLKVGQHIDVVLMMVSASQILYAYVLERDTLDPLYAKFLIMHGAKDVRLIDGVASEYKGWGFKWELIQDWCEENNVDFRRIKHDLVNGFQGCCVVHPGQTCIPHFLTFFKDAFVRAAVLYVPAHVISMGISLLLKIASLLNFSPSSFRQAQLLQQQREKELLPSPDTDTTTLTNTTPTNHTIEENLRVEQGGTAESLARYLRWIGQQIADKSRGKSPEIVRFIVYKIIWRLGSNIIRSSSFLGLYCSTAWLTACIIFRLHMTSQRSYFRWVLAFAGLPSLLEVPTRRRELMLYCMTHTLECAVAEMRKYHLLPSLLMSEGFKKNGNVVLFCFASAVFVFCYQSEPASVRPAFLTLMKALWG